MAAPLALTPIAWTVLRVGAVAAVGYYVSRRTAAKPKDAWREAALDQAKEGLEVTTDRSGAESNAHASGRFLRTVRLSRHGPGVEIDIAALGRIRLRRVD